MSINFNSLSSAEQIKNDYLQRFPNNPSLTSGGRGCCDHLSLALERIRQTSEQENPQILQEKEINIKRTDDGIDICCLVCHKALNLLKDEYRGIYKENRFSGFIQEVQENEPSPVPIEGASEISIPGPTAVPIQADLEKIQKFIRANRKDLTGSLLALVEKRLTGRDKELFLSLPEEARFQLLRRLSKT